MYSLVWHVKRCNNQYPILLIPLLHQSPRAYSATLLTWQVCSTVALMILWNSKAMGHVTVKHVRSLYLCSHAFKETKLSVSDRSDLSREECKHCTGSKLLQKSCDVTFCGAKAVFTSSFCHPQMFSFARCNLSYMQVKCCAEGDRMLIDGIAHPAMFVLQRILFV